MFEGPTTSIGYVTPTIRHWTLPSPVTRSEAGIFSVGAARLVLAGESGNA